MPKRWKNPSGPGVGPGKSWLAKFGATHSLKTSALRWFTPSSKSRRTNALFSESLMGRPFLLVPVVPPRWADRMVLPARLHPAQRTATGNSRHVL